VQIIAFDFTTKTEKNIPLQDVPFAAQQQQFCWIDIAPHELLLLEQVPDLGISADLLNSHEDLFFYESGLGFTLTEARYEQGVLSSVPVQIILTDQLLITIDHAQAKFLQRVRQSYHDDFVRFAQSPGFLLFEIADHLVEVYQHTLHKFAKRNEQLQISMFGDKDDQVFRETAQMVSHLLSFRTLLVVAQEVVEELATRNSAFISQTTRPFLERKAHRIGALCTEILHERDGLVSSLNLYLGMTSYRTNRIIKKLTVFNIIFLPLGFLVGLYGMNFEAMPELKWEYGYWFFWGLVILVLAVVGVIARRSHWL